MLEAASFLKSLTDALRSITDITGLIYKNIESYDKIKYRNERQALANAFGMLLISLSEMEYSNQRTLWLIGRMAAKYDDSNPYNYVHADEIEFSVTSMLETVQDRLTAIKLISSEIIKYDHKLYEALVHTMKRESTF